jgi:hypothetical protein
MAEQFDLAELERLHAAAMGCPHSLGEGAKPVHELTNYLTTHLPAILAMGAERERLRGEREKMAKALIKTWGVLEPICPWGSKDKIMSEHAEALAIARRIAK